MFLSGTATDVAADVEREALVAVAEAIREAELEGQVFARVAVVVDQDLVERILVEREVVRAAVGVLQRQVVGEHRHVACAAGLVAVEQVEVGRIHGRHARDVRRLAVAGRLARGGRERREHGDGELSGRGCHRVSPGARGSALFLPDRDTQETRDLDAGRVRAGRIRAAGSLRILVKMAAETGRAADSEVAGLLAACARQDRQAFQRLYERTAPQLLACLIRILRQRALAEDALQDVFVQVWGRAGQYESSRGSAWAWLIAIARYRAIDLRRRESAPRRRDRIRTSTQIPGEDEPEDALAALGRHASKALTTLSRCAAAAAARMHRARLPGRADACRSRERDRRAARIGEELDTARAGGAQAVPRIMKRDEPENLDLLAAEYALGTLRGRRAPELRAPASARTVRGPARARLGRALCVAGAAACSRSRHRPAVWPAIAAPHRRRLAQRLARARGRGRTGRGARLRLDRLAGTASAAGDRGIRERRGRDALARRARGATAIASRSRRSARSACRMRARASCGRCPRAARRCRSA